MGSSIFVIGKEKDNRLDFSRLMTTWLAVCPTNSHYLQPQVCQSIITKEISAILTQLYHEQIYNLIKFSAVLDLISSKSLHRVLCSKDKHTALQTMEHKSSSMMTCKDHTNKPPTCLNQPNVPITTNIGSGMRMSLNRIFRHKSDT